VSQFSQPQTARRIARNADLDAAARSGPYEIIKKISLPSNHKKFHAWITSNRGRNGWEVKGPDGNTYVTGDKTIRDLVERNAISNPSKYFAAHVS
jgi:hypothetical protein